MKKQANWLDCWLIQNAYYTCVFKLEENVYVLCCAVCPSGMEDSRVVELMNCGFSFKQNFDHVFELNYLFDFCFGLRKNWLLLASSSNLSFPTFPFPCSWLSLYPFPNNTTVENFYQYTVFFSFSKLGTYILLIISLKVWKSAATYSFM